MSVEQVIKETTIRNRPMPEIFARQDIRNSGGWDVGHASAVRGEPFITVSGRIMRVPMDDSELSKAIRAHEQIHVKISPQDLAPYVTDMTPEGAIRSAEEARVNFIASQLGYNMKAMVSGSEKHDGKIITESEDWANAVYAMGASCFTGSLTPFIAGVRSVNPEWATVLRDSSKEVIKFMKSQLREIKKRRWGANSTPEYLALAEMGSTQYNNIYDGDNYVDLETIKGMNITISLALLLQAIADMPAPTAGSSSSKEGEAGEAGEGGEAEGEEGEADGQETQKGESDDSEEEAELKGNGEESGELEELADEEDKQIDRKDIQKRAKDILNDRVHEHGGQGSWQPVKLGHVVRSLTVQGAIGRKRVASETGRNPRRIHRLISDPQRRIFDKYVKASGGVVVIDLSGSMSLSKDQVRDIMLASKGCTIIGYSGGRHDLPNTFILGDKGKICDEIPDVAGGNLCDLSVMEYAITKKQNAKAPVLWVTDGMTYKAGYGGRGWTDELECCKFAIKHRIHMEYTPDDAVSYLKGLQKGETHKPRVLPRWREMFTIHTQR